MNDIKQLIKQARAVMRCPSCGRSYKDKEITLKGYMDSTYVLHASCSNQHATIYTTWVTSYAPIDSDETAPVDNDHVLSLYQALKSFDGNFKSLWSTER